MVRAKPKNLPGCTFLIDSETHLVQGAQKLQFVKGVGFVGLQTKYGDFREVDGLTLPFKIESQFANRFLGKVEITFDEGQSGIETGNLFDLPQ